MNKKLLRICLTVLMTMVIWIMLYTISNAASFDASISSTSVTVGDTVTVTVKANNAAGMYNVSANNSNMSKASGDASEFLENASATITYKAEKAGTTVITAKASDMTDLDDDTKAVTGSKTFTVTIKEKQTQEAPKQEQPKEEPKKEETKKEEPKKEEVKKGTIDTFYINGIKVKQYLNVTNKDSVSIKVNTSTKEGATVYNSATKKSYKLKSGTATNIQIVEGTNTLTITLDTGHKETRKIYSQKEEVVEPNVIEEKKEEVKVLLKSLGIKASISEEENVDISLTPEFSSEVYEYNVLLDESLADVTKLNIDAVPTSDEFKVEISGNEDLKVGHNTITITVKSKDEKNTATYKILVAKLAKIVPVVAEPVVEVQQEVVKPLWNRNQQILISVFTSIIAIMGIVYAVIEYRYKKGPEEGIPNSGSTLEEDLNKDIQIDDIGDIPFAKVGFEKENTDKVDILKEEESTQNKEIEDKNEIEEPKKEKRRGKHF